MRQAIDEDRDVKQEGDDGHGRDQGDGNPPAFQAVSLLFSAGPGHLNRIVLGRVHQGFASVEIFADSSFPPLALIETIEPKTIKSPTNVMAPM
jgi:hypothetical protein